MLQGKLIRVDVNVWNADESKKVAIGRVACNVYNSPWKPHEVFKHLITTESGDTSSNNLSSTS